MAEPESAGASEAQPVRRSWLTLAALLLGPLAWAVQVNAGFVIAHWFCSGTAATIALHATTVVAFLTAGAGVAIAWKQRANTPDTAHSDAAERSASSIRLGAWLAIALGVLSMCGIAAGGIAAVLLGGCS